MATWLLLRYTSSVEEFLDDRLLLSDAQESLQQLLNLERGVDLERCAKSSVCLPVHSGKKNRLRSGVCVLVSYTAQFLGTEEKPKPIYKHIYLSREAILSRDTGTTNMHTYQLLQHGLWQCHGDGISSKRLCFSVRRTKGVAGVEEREWWRW